MLGLAVGFLIAGVYLLSLTIPHARNDEDLRDSERYEAELKKELGVFGKYTRIGWEYRATYRHPVLMRLPGGLSLLAGAVLLIVATR